MRFGEPDYLYALLLIPFLFFILMLLFRNKWHKIMRFISKDFYNELVPGFRKRIKVIKIIFAVLGLSFLLLSLARPQYGKIVQEAEVSGTNVMIVFDVSNSMHAEDMKPSRMAKARHSMKRFVDMLGGDRVGLVAFSGSAVLVAPLTSDHSVFKMYIDSLDSTFLSSKGTALAKGVDLAVDSIKRTTDGEGTNIVLLVTDGEDHEGEIDKVIEKANESNVKLFVLAVGTESGAPVPNYDFMGRKVGYKKDNGEVVISKINTRLLNKIAAKTGGALYFSTHSESEIKKIVNVLQDFERKKFKDKRVVKHKERYRWALVPSFIFLLLGALL